MRPIKIVSAVLGALAVLAALGAVAVSAVLVWANSQRDAEGYFMTGTERLETAAAALVGNRLGFDVERDRDWAPTGLGTLRIAASRPDGGAVFVGIAPRDEVEAYLRGVAHAEVTDLDAAGESDRYQVTPGGRLPRDPAGEGFWEVWVSGRGVQRVEWPVTDGAWTAVVMNADGAPGVSVDVRGGLATDLLRDAAIGAGVAAAVLAALGGAAMVYGLRGEQLPGYERRPRASTAATVERVARPRRAGTYPLQLQGHPDRSPSRWLWLVKWLLALPHAVILAVLWPVAALATLVAGVVILVTGRYPRALFDFSVGVIAWTWRVTFYAVTLGTDRYPSFGLRSDPTYPARLTVEYPERLSRPLVLVKWWLLALPHYAILTFLAGGLRVAPAEGLIGVLVLFAGVALAVTGRYPAGLFELITGLQRWALRVLAYAALLTDEYPPFRLDMGGDEPIRPEPEPSAPDPHRAGGSRLG